MSGLQLFYRGITCYRPVTYIYIYIYIYTYIHIYIYMFLTTVAKENREHTRSTYIYMFVCICKCGLTSCFVEGYNYFIKVLHVIGQLHTVAVSQCELGRPVTHVVAPRHVCTRANIVSDRLPRHDTLKTELNSHKDEETKVKHIKR